MNKNEGKAKVSKAFKPEVKQDEPRQACPVNLATGIADAVKDGTGIKGLKVDEDRLYCF